MARNYCVHPPGITMRTVLILAAAAAFSGPAAAADYEWGCKILLCLGAPSDPECAPDIRKLHRQLARGKPFPSCTFEGSDETFAKLVRDAYDLCPEGTAPVTGLVALSSEPRRYASSDPGYRRESEGASGWGPRACVGPAVSSYELPPADDSGESAGEVTVYDWIEWQQPNASTRAIDLYIEQRLHSRTRF